MPKLTLQDVANLSGAESTAIARINTNSEAIENAFENTLSRDGSSPNQMQADIDMNSNDLLNVSSIQADEFILNGKVLAPTDLGTIPPSVMLKGIYDPQLIEGDSFDRNNHTGPVVWPVESRTILKALDTSLFNSVYLQEGKRQGIFKFEAGDYSAEIAQDTAEGLFIKADDTLATAGAWVRQYDGEALATWFGAVGDGVTDDTTALQAFASLFNYYRQTESVSWKIPEGKYLVTNTISFYEDPTGGIFRSTLDWTNVDFIWDRDRVGREYVIAFGDPDDPIEGNNTVDVKGRVLFSKGPNCTFAPIALYVAVSGQSIFNGVNVNQNWDNTVCHFQGVQNIAAYDYVIYSGGRSFLYSDTSGSLFRQTGTSLQRVSGTYEFPTTCVGKIIEIGNGLRKARINARVSATEVTLDNSATDSVDRAVFFGSPAPTTVAGSPDVVLDGPVTSDMVGLIIGIPRAGTNGGVHWAEIIAANPGTSTITLNRNVPISRTPASDSFQTTEIATPVIFVDSFKAVDGGVFSNGISQVRFYNLQIETYRGVALGVDDAEFVHFYGAKVHGNSSPTASLYACAAIWANRLSGTFEGEFDQRILGMQLTFFGDQTLNFHFPHLAVRMREYEDLIRKGISTLPGGTVSFGVLNTNGLQSGVAFTDIVTDANSTSKVIPPYWFLDATRGPIDFDISPQPFNPAPIIADAATGGNTASYLENVGTYYRRNGVFHFAIRFININTTGLTAGNPIHIRNLPFPIRGGTNNLVTCSIRYSGISASGMVAFADNGDNYLILYPQNSTNNVLVSAITSGTNTLLLSGSYLL